MLGVLASAGLNTRKITSIDKKIEGIFKLNPSYLVTRAHGLQAHYRARNRVRTLARPAHRRVSRALLDHSLAVRFAGATGDLVKIMRNISDSMAIIASSHIDIHADYRH